jgi:hypothetical protein
MRPSKSLYARDFPKNLWHALRAFVGSAEPDGKGIANRDVQIPAHSAVGIYMSATTVNTMILVITMSAGFRRRKWSKTEIDPISVRIFSYQKAARGIPLRKGPRRLGKNWENSLAAGNLHSLSTGINTQINATFYVFSPILKPSLKAHARI